MAYSVIEPLKTEDEAFTQGFFENAHALPSNYNLTADDLAGLLNAWQRDPAARIPRSGARSAHS